MWRGGYGYGYGYQKEEPLDVEEAWRKEERMGKRSRRERYKCGNKYMKLVDILPWPLYWEQSVLVAFLILLCRPET